MWYGMAADSGTTWARFLVPAGSSLDKLSSNVSFFGEVLGVGAFWGFLGPFWILGGATTLPISKTDTEGGNRILLPNSRVPSEHTLQRIGSKDVHWHPPIAPPPNPPGVESPTQNPLPSLARGRGAPIISWLGSRNGCKSARWEQPGPLVGASVACTRSINVLLAGWQRGRCSLFHAANSPWGDNS